MYLTITRQQMTANKNCCYSLNTIGKRQQEKTHKITTFPITLTVIIRQTHKCNVNNHILKLKFPHKINLLTVTSVLQNLHLQLLSSSSVVHTTHLGTYQALKTTMMLRRINKWTVLEFHPFFHWVQNYTLLLKSMGVTFTSDGGLET